MASAEQNPLYRQNFKALSLQVMDLETIHFLLENGKPRLSRIEDSNDAFQKLSWNKIQSFFPERAWFNKPDHFESIHGFRHLARSVIYTAVLSQLEEYSEPETKIACVIAGIHDLGRVDDRNDNCIVV